MDIKDHSMLHGDKYYLVALRNIGYYEDTLGPFDTVAEMENAFESLRVVLDASFEISNVGAE